MVVGGADGVNSVVRKELFGEVPGRVISTYQVDASYRMEDQDSVDVFLGSGFSSGFFAWATPAGHLSRIGLGVYHRNATAYFNRLISMFPGARVLGINGGGIPIRYLKRTYRDSALLVGDAAGIVKPLSGGGIYTGLVSASAAAETLEKALESDDLSARSLSRYQRAWKRRLGMELSFDYLVQRFFTMLSDRALDAIYREVSKPEVVNLINSVGDIDYPSRVVLRVLMKNPSMVFNFLRGK
ncbi:NAD(P)/FAD-dependent oxidoreductase [Thermogymnomonas acidicola]|uniref:NAD(P)/FAD-dependent oxidoreductase n=1 Tax=Thermogymnomonas acidicola TaxID=399579 RepID=UPI0014941838|nr:NAD(P)/FAD-dependent oxidoreductase [Thermogymnomonas acidicola]